MENMEKRSQIRITGNIDSDRKDELRNAFKDVIKNPRLAGIWSDKDWNDIEDMSRPMSEKEKHIFESANTITSAIVKKYGGESFDIPVDNCHIIPTDLMDRLSRAFGRTGTAVQETYSVLINMDHISGSLSEFALLIGHEITHLKQGISFQIKDENSGRILRSGLMTYPSVKKYEEGEEYTYFNGLNEAVVAEVEKIVFEQLSQDPVFADEYNWLSSEEADELRRKVAEEMNLPIKDIAWVARSESEINPSEEEYKKRYRTYSYPSQRSVLQYVCSEIQKQYSDQFIDSKFVLDEFIKAHFGAHLASIGRLVEGTFGQGSFRELGAMEPTDESAEYIMGVLKNMRKDFMSNE